MPTRYWGYRIDTRHRDFFQRELLKNGRLRQGWGYDPAHNLRQPITHPEVAKSLRMFEEVKNGHFLLVPSLLDWGSVSVVEATEDWDIGYQFEIPEEYKDYGHIFPARFLKKFSRQSRHVTGNIRSTLKYRGRFWNIDHYGEDIDRIREIDDARLEELDRDLPDGDRLIETINSAFDEVFSCREFAKSVYDKLNTQFSAQSWESVLEEALKSLYPHAHIQRVGGRSESEHGTDIKITIPGLSNKNYYVIAVQVKDHEGIVSESVIDQIDKASYWDKGREKLIEKVVIFTRAKIQDNSNLVTIGNEREVKFVFADDLEAILARYAMRRMGLDVAD